MEKISTLPSTIYIQNILMVTDTADIRRFKLISVIIIPSSVALLSLVLSIHEFHEIVAYEMPVNAKLRQEQR
jgi:hypothetical protein